MAHGTRNKAARRTPERSSALIPIGMDLRAIPARCAGWRSTDMRFRNSVGFRAYARSSASMCDCALWQHVGLETITKINAAGQNPNSDPPSQMNLTHCGRLCRWYVAVQSGVSDCRGVSDERAHAARRPELGRGRARNGRYRQVTGMRHEWGCPAGRRRPRFQRRHVRDSTESRYRNFRRDPGFHFPFPLCLWTVLELRVGEWCAVGCIYSIIA